MKMIRDSNENICSEDAFCQKLDDAYIDFSDYFKNKFV